MTSNEQTTTTDSNKSVVGDELEGVSDHDFSARSSVR